MLLPPRRRVPNAAELQPKETEYLPQRRKGRKGNPPFIPLWQRGKEGDLLNGVPLTRCRLYWREKLLYFR